MLKWKLLELRPKTVKVSCLFSDSVKVSSNWDLNRNLSKPKFTKEINATLSEFILILKSLFKFE